MSLNNLSTLQFNYNLNGLQDISTGEGNVLPVTSGSNITVVNDTTQYIVNLNDNISIDSINAGTGTFTYLSATHFTGSTGTISNIYTNQIQFNTGAFTGVDTEGLLYWDNSDNTNTLHLILDDNVSHHIGEETLYRVKASANITKGQCVMFDGTLGSSGILKAKPTYGNISPEYFMGVALENILLNEFGYVSQFGYFRGINTLAYTEGTLLYMNPSSTGALTNVEPTAPNTKILVAAVVNSGNASNGSIFIRPSIFPRLSDLNQVYTTGAANNDLFFYDGSKWINKPRNDALNGISLTGATIYNLTGTNANITNLTTVNLTGTNMAFTGASLGYLTVTGKTPLNLAISQTDSSAGNSFNGYVNFNEKTYMYGNMAASYIANHINPLNAILYSINNDTVLSCTANASSRIYFRPQGYLTSTNQAYIDNTGQLVNQSINTGLVTCTDNTITNGLEIQGRRSGTSKSIYQSDVTGINDFRGNTNNYGSNYFLGGAGTVVNFSPTVGVTVQGTITASSGAITNLSATNSIVTNLTGTNATITNATITNLTASSGAVTNLRYTTSTGTTSFITNATVTNGTITNLSATAITAPTITATSTLYAPTRLLGTHGGSDSFWIGMTGTGVDSSRVAIGVEGLTDGSGLIQNLRFRTNNAQRMIIDTNGLVGIGRTPSYILDVNSTSRFGENGTSSYLINLGHAGVGSYRAAYIYGDGSNMELNNQQNGALILSTNNIERFRISGATGYVGIGTNAPIEKLQVAYGNIQLGFNQADYRNIIIGGGNNYGYIGGNFPVNGDGILMSYNYNIANNSRPTATSAAAIKVGYGLISFHADVLTSGVPTQQMTLTSAGRLGINVTAPDYLLDVNGTAQIRSDSRFLGAITQINSANNAFANGIFIRKQRPGGVLGNNELGYFYFGGYSSDNVDRNTALIYAGSEDNFVPTSCPTYLAFFTTNTGANSPSERIRIRGNGNVGIGVSNPNAKLVVQNAVAADANIQGNGLNANIWCKDTGGSVYNGGTIVFGASQGMFCGIKGSITDGGDNTAGYMNFCVRTSRTAADMTNRGTLSAGLFLGETVTNTSYRLELERRNDTAYFPAATFTQDADTNFTIAATPGSRANTTDSIVGQIGLLYKASPVGTTYISSGMRFYRGAGANDSYMGITTNTNTLRYLCDSSGYHYFGMLTDTPSIATTNNTHNFRSQAYANGVGTSKCLSKGDGNFVARARFDYAGATTYTVAGGRVKIQGSNGSNTNHSAWQNASDDIKADWTGVYKLHLNINLYSAVGTQAAIFIYKGGAVVQTTWMDCRAGQIVTCNATGVIEATRLDVIDVRIEPQTASVNVNNDSIAWLTFEG